MTCYAAFGGVLESAHPLTVFRAVAAASPQWTLRVAEGEAPALEGELLGEDEVQAGVRVRLHRGEQGYSLSYDDTGRFDISSDGSEITWYAAAAASPESVELDIAGRVLATAMYAAGDLCLHGSGVVLGSEGVGFLAPKLHGKSTLAQSLVAAGARLATDDVLPVQAGDPPVMRPGVHRIRLWSDSAERLVPERVGADATVAKHSVEHVDESQLLSEPTQLNAIYLLVPMKPGEHVKAVERQRVASREAVLSVLANATLGPLLGRSEAPRLFQLACAIAECVPVYSLRYVRDFERLGEVVEGIMGWHGQHSATQVERPQ